MACNWCGLIPVPSPCSCPQHTQERPNRTPPRTTPWLHSPCSHAICLHLHLHLLLPLHLATGRLSCCALLCRWGCGKHTLVLAL